MNQQASSALAKAQQAFGLWLGQWISSRSTQVGAEASQAAFGGGDYVIER